MRCPSCGEVVPDGSHLCQSCGWDSYAFGSDPGQEGPSTNRGRNYDVRRRGLQEPMNRVYLVVVATIVVVLLATTYVLMMFEAIDDEGPDIVKVNLAPAVIQNRTLEDEVHWDATFHVNKVTPRDSIVRWAEVRVSLLSESGDVLVERMELEPDAPLNYDDGTDGLVDIEAWYVDLPTDGRMNSEDRFIITGLDRDHQGCSVILLRRVDSQWEQIASGTLPLEFP